jgi:two-component system, sensor histidine kinase and response regulator
MLMRNAASKTVSPPAIARLRELGEPNGPDLLGELIGMYLADAPRFMTELRQAVAASDCRSVMDTAHKLKGSSANLGAERLEEICRELEQIARAGALEGAEGLLEKMNREFVVVRTVLTAEIGK